MEVPCALALRTGKFPVHNAYARRSSACKCICAWRLRVNMRSGPDCVPIMPNNLGVAQVMGRYWGAIQVRLRMLARNFYEHVCFGRGISVCLSIVHRFYPIFLLSPPNFALIFSILAVSYELGPA